MDNINYEVGEVIETYVYREEGTGHSSTITSVIIITVLLGIGCYFLGRIVSKRWKGK